MMDSVDDKEQNFFRYLLTHWWNLIAAWTSQIQRIFISRQGNKTFKITFLFNGGLPYLKDLLKPSPFTSEAQKKVHSSQQYSAIEGFQQLNGFLSPTRLTFPYELLFVFSNNIWTRSLEGCVKAPTSNFTIFREFHFV